MNCLAAGGGGGCIGSKRTDGPLKLASLGDVLNDVSRMVCKKPSSVLAG